MAYEPIESLEVENYGCIRKATFKLTPLHALIGPNDSGKSTVLRALRTAAQFAAGTFDNDMPFNPMLTVPNRKRSTTIDVRYAAAGSYGIRVRADGVYEEAQTTSRHYNPTDVRNWAAPGLLAARTSTPVVTGQGRRNEVAREFVLSDLRSRITTATMVRFDPDALRKPSNLLLDSDGIRFASERGAGLPGIYDAIFNRYSDARGKIEESMKALFPTVASVGFINASAATKAIAVTLTDGTRIGADAMSEGLLYYLAFLALRYVDGSRLILVEEPENGLHPARIAEVMTVLREISRTSQVILATHSPLVVNELDGGEVSVVTRDPESGTTAVLLKDVPGFADASKVYQPGEFWVSYADGKTEEPLRTGKPRTWARFGGGAAPT